MRLCWGARGWGRRVKYQEPLVLLAEPSVIFYSYYSCTLASAVRPTTAEGSYVPVLQYSCAVEAPAVQLYGCSTSSRKSYGLRLYVVIGHLATIHKLRASTFSARLRAVGNFLLPLMRCALDAT